MDFLDFLQEYCEKKSETFTEFKLILSEVET